MDVVPLITAMIVVVLALGIVAVAEMASSLKRKDRYLKHDLNGALTPILLELDKLNEGMVDDPKKAKQLIMAMRGFLNPEGEATVKLFRYLKLIATSYSEIEVYESSDPIVTVDLGDLHRVMVNALQNALEARSAANSTAPVRIHLDESSISISNPASSEDRSHVINPIGSTRGKSRGSGLRSIRDSCARIGWLVRWKISGERVVITLGFA